MENILCWILTMLMVAIGLGIIGGMIFLWVRIMWNLGGLLGRICKKN